MSKTALTALMSTDAIGNVPIKSFLIEFQLFLLIFISQSISNWKSN